MFKDSRETRAIKNFDYVMQGFKILHLKRIQEQAQALNKTGFKRDQTNGWFLPH